MNHQRINPVDLISQKNAEPYILDVRTAAEVQAESLPGCIYIPLHELTPERLQAELSKRGKATETVFLLCQSGRRAEMAADQLQGHISPMLSIIEGGMNAVKQAQIPIQQTGRPVMSLERQVRIAAGFLVLGGVVLGTWVNPAFYGLAGFVGGGLMFAGITDTCMMGMLIARMPWNK
ncbi:MAG: rhodanese-like domain-containing protein [Pseudomonadota bacterium]